MDTGADNSDPGTAGVREYVDAEGTSVMTSVITADDVYHYTCSVCSKLFKRKNLCLQHLKATHGVKVDDVKCVGGDVRGPPNCPHCGKQFNQKSNLYRHLRIAHGGKGIPIRREKKRDVKCPMCTLCFTTVTCVNRHIRLHHSFGIESNSEVLSSCHFCEMKFTDESKCVAHMSDFHHAVYNSCINDDGLQAEFYKCSLCDVQIDSQSQLKEHLLDIHGKNLNEFRVEVMSEEEEDKKETNEVFNCDSCNASYEVEDKWRSHMKDLHKAFPDACCPRCGDHSFQTINELKCHMRNVHSVTFPSKNLDANIRRKVALRASADNLGLNIAEFRALEKIPDWLVKHGGGQVLVYLEKNA